MPLNGELFLAVKEEIVHHFATHEGFKRKGREHVESETEAGDVDESVVRGEVIEYVT